MIYLSKVWSIQVPHRREALKLSHGPLPVVHVLAQESGWLERFDRQRGWRGISSGRFSALLSPVAHEGTHVFIFSKRFKKQWLTE